MACAAVMDAPELPFASFYVSIMKGESMAFFHSDLNRAFSKANVLSVLGTMLCVLVGAFSDVLAMLDFSYENMDTAYGNHELFTKNTSSIA